MLRLPGIRKSYRGVGTLYLEDLNHFYQAILHTQSAALEMQRKDIERWHSLHTLQRELATDNDPSESEQVPEVYTKPIIKLRSDEFEFDCFDQITRVQRPYFREFEFDANFGEVFVRIAAGKVDVTTRMDAPIYVTAVEDIATVILRRTNRFINLLYHPAVHGVWVLIALLQLALALIPSTRGISVYITPVVWLGILSRVLYTFSWARRKRVVVPRLEAHGGRGFWDQYGLALGTMVSIVAMIVAILSWLFPRR